MLVNEIFYSLQGEGFLAGTPSAFIRLTGCPLRCRFCDTKYAWDENAGTDYTIDKIIETIEQFKTKFVVITGGQHGERNRAFLERTKLPVVHKPFRVKEVVEMINRFTGRPAHQ